MAALILFGGGGDLAMRMLLPSLYFLERDGLLAELQQARDAAAADGHRAGEKIASLEAALRESQDGALARQSEA